MTLLCPPCGDADDVQRNLVAPGVWRYECKRRSARHPDSGLYAWSAPDASQNLTTDSAPSLAGDRGAFPTPLTDLCIRDVDVLALPAIDIAAEFEDPGPFMPVLRARITNPTTDLYSLMDMADHLPETGDGFVDCAEGLAQRLIEAYRPLALPHLNAGLPRWAAALHKMSDTLSDAGRYEPAVAAIRATVESIQGWGSTCGFESGRVVGV